MQKFTGETYDKRNTIKYLVLRFGKDKQQDPARNAKITLPKVKIG